MVHRLRKILLVLLLVSVTGGQWAMLQSAAWAGMLISNLRTESMPAALSRTFDGKHPCALCRVVDHGRKSEDKSEFASKLFRIEFPPIDSACVLIADERGGPFIAPFDEFSESLSFAPLLRPPRPISA
jgi:hypothetical protein